jgi:hypothetical protein
VREREITTDDYIHDLDKIYLKVDIKTFDDFVSVSCRRDDVRVIMSEILHESTKNDSVDVRRIVLS